MRIEHGGRSPAIDPSAYVSPAAVLSGDVRVGPDSRVLHGAVLTSEGGPVEVGARCVVMENAVLRGTRRHPMSVGDDVLIGPRASLSGCTVEDEVFLATGTTVFNAAVIGRGSEVRVNGVVHVRSVLPPGSMVPIGWVAVGDPAEFFPPDQHDRLWPIQRERDFPGTVFGLPRDAPLSELTARYTRALSRHLEDRVLDAGSDESSDGASGGGQNSL
jgi:carbonic anhydrase/acetyltransferase-like protein (isoleucine patch superfamily)